MGQFAQPHWQKIESQKHCMWILIGCASSLTLILLICLQANQIEDWQVGAFWLTDQNQVSLVLSLLEYNFSLMSISIISFHYLKTK